MDSALATSADLAETKRFATGVTGLDDLIQGGLRAGDFILLSGGIGTGKTIFTSQFAHYGAKVLNEPAVFATFEEDVASLRKNMSIFGMDLGALEREKKLKLLDLDALEGRGMGSNLDTLLAALDDLKAKRLIVDSITAFLSGAHEKFDYSFLMHLIYKTLKRDGVTTIMTESRFGGPSEYSTLEEFTADGVFLLENVLTENMELRTRFMVRKLRGTDHSKKYHSVVFGPRGLEILPYSV
jgi:circadian clock protein KaiC